jgi:hypothetical protein
VLVVACETLAVAQVIDSVQQVGFALTVQSDKTIDLVRETQVCLADILIIEYGKPFQYHEIRCKGTPFIP